MKKIYTLFLLGWAIISTAQEKGVLRLYITPDPEIVLIDGEELKSGNTVELAAGEHKIQSWLTNKKLLDTTVVIAAGKTHQFFFQLESSQEYKKYLGELEDYNKLRNKHLGVPIIATSLSAGALAFTYFKGKSVEREALDLFEEYKFAGADLKKKRLEFETAQNNYKKYYYAQYVEYAAMAVSTYFLIKGIQWVKKNPAPSLQKDSNPLTLREVGIVPNFRTGGGYSVGLTFSIN